MAKALSMANMTPERRAEIDAQRVKHEAEAARWNELFAGLDERVLKGSMEHIASELAESGDWAGGPPVMKSRPHGAGRKASAEFKVRGLTDESTQARVVAFGFELYPSADDKFVVACDVNGKVQRETFRTEEFRSEDHAAADEKLRSWINGQFERHIRRAVRA